MQRLNAIDAIAPAFTRTHEILFKPFRLGRTWKLAATSYVAYCGSIFIPLPLLLLFARHPAGQSPNSNLPALWIVAVLFSLLYLSIVYCGARMEFVEFELVVTRAKFIRPMWRKYGARVWPWIAVKVVIGTVLCFLFAPWLYASSKGLFETFSLQQSGAPSDPALFSVMMHSILHFYAAFFSIMFSLKLVATMLADFVLPFYVLEDMPLFSAVRQASKVILEDPLQVILYLILKPILAILGFIMQYIASLVCFIPIAIIFGVLFGVGAVVSRNLGSTVHLGLAVGGVFLYLVGVICFMFLLIGFYGYLLTLLDAYAIYFLGGRYPLLGGLLEPGPDRPFTPPPIFPSREEEKDDDGGPPLPMDPALA